MNLSTELDAVNVLLTATGSVPINTLEGTTNGGARTAISILREVTREVQTEEWHFNTVPNVELTPNGEGEIELPGSIVSIKATQPVHMQDVVQRGDRLFDRKNNTKQFTGPVKLNITYQLSWDELPEQARRYITVRSARVFHMRVIRSEEGIRFSLVDEQKARQTLEAFDASSERCSMFDSYSVARVLDREI